jgi:flagellar motor switch protein FliM
MNADDDLEDPESGTRKLRGAMLEHSGLVVERMPGLAAALELFAADATSRLAPLVGASSAEAAIEPPRSTALFQAIGDCAGLTAAVYACAEPEARALIALDERIDELLVDAIFGESVSTDLAGGASSNLERARTAIETALTEEFSRALGMALERGFASVAPISLAFERLVTLTDPFALGRRDLPAAAARFSLAIAGASCECLILLPQTLLLPFRKELEQDLTKEPSSGDRRWSSSLETGVKQTRLPVVAVLEETPMTLGEIAALRVGAILPLGSSHFDAVRLECGGRGMFLCRLGQGEGRYRLEVASPIAQPADPAPSLPASPPTPQPLL